MIEVLTAMYAWIAFYISWQAHRSYTNRAKAVFSVLYALSVALIAYGLTLHYIFFDAAEKPGVPDAIINALANATPAFVAGFLILMPTVLADVKKFRSRVVTKQP